MIKLENCRGPFLPASALLSCGEAGFLDLDTIRCNMPLTEFRHNSNPSSFKRSHMWTFRSQLLRKGLLLPGANHCSMQVCVRPCTGGHKIPQPMLRGRVLPFTCNYACDVSIRDSKECMTITDGIVSCICSSASEYCGYRAAGAGFPEITHTNRYRVVPLLFNQANVFYDMFQAVCAINTRCQPWKEIPVRSKLLLVAGNLLGKFYKKASYLTFTSVTSITCHGLLAT